jgi:hypothetical protein
LVTDTLRHGVGRLARFGGASLSRLRTVRERRDETGSTIR